MITYLHTLQYVGICIRMCISIILRVTCVLCWYAVSRATFPVRCHATLMLMCLNWLLLLLLLFMAIVLHCHVCSVHDWCTFPTPYSYKMTANQAPYLIFRENPFAQLVSIHWNFSHFYTHCSYYLFVKLASNLITWCIWNCFTSVVRLAGHVMLSGIRGISWARMFSFCTTLGSTSRLKKAKKGTRQGRKGKIEDEHCPYARANFHYSWIYHWSSPSSIATPSNRNQDVTSWCKESH